MRLLIGFLPLLIASSAMAQEAGPTLVSLDYCADQFVLGLADREQILALSKDAEKPFSHLRAQAGGIPKVRAITEDIVALQPDVVVRSWGGDTRALAMFERLGIKIVQIGYASDIEGAADVTKHVAAELGQPERGAYLISVMPRAAPSTPHSALYVTPGGVTAGQGTMVNSMMNHAGLENAVTAQGWRPLPLEALVLNPPTIALTAFFEFGADASDQWSPARHPVLRRVLDAADTYSLNESRLTCPAWFVADEAAALAEAFE